MLIVIEYLFLLNWSSFVESNWGASFFFFFHSTLLDTRRRSDSVITEITLVRLSARPSLNFIKIGSLVFSNILHNNSWSSYLVTDKARLLKKKFGSQKFGPMGLNQAQNKVFRHFVEFGLYVFPKIAHNDNLWQCLTFSRGKTHDKTF